MKVRVCVSLLLAALFGPFGFAQDTPNHEVSIGYSFLGSWFTPHRHGWVASFSERVNGRLWIKAEAGGNYQDTFFFTGSQPDFIHSILAGPEFKLRKDSKFVPWAHALVGINLNNHSGLTVGLGSSSLQTFRLTDVRFGFQPGGGVDYYFTPKVGIRLGADYRRAISNNRYDQDFLRLHSGIVFRFGGR
jgi:hypothetical protein